MCKWTFGTIPMSMEQPSNAYYVQAYSLAFQSSWFLFDTCRLEQIETHPPANRGRAWERYEDACLTNLLPRRNYSHMKLLLIIFLSVNAFRPM